MRDLGTLAALVGGTHRPVTLLEAQFPDGFARWSTLPVDLEWEAVTWRGAGRVLGIGPAAADASGRADGMTITLSGIAADAELVALALSGDWQGSTVRRWYAAVNDAGEVVHAVRERTGRVHVVELDDDGARVTIVVTVETAALDGRLAVDSFISDASQRRIHSGDAFFTGFEAQLGLIVPWGRG